MRNFKPGPRARLCAALLLLVAGVACGAADTASLEQAAAGAHRSEANKARDAHRHPVETLSFFGITPTMEVVEILPGEGWYTEILAPYLKPAGKLAVGTYDPQSSSEYERRSTAALYEKLDASPELYGAVERRVMFQGDKIVLGPPGSADMVVTFRNSHNWISSGKAEAVYKACYEVLKSGGILGIEQHRAAPGVDVAASAKKGYVPEAYLVAMLEELGFKLAGSSEINANPRDTKDYADGVWTLPPVLRLGDKDREKYVAIGESDRMTLKFVKP